MEIQIKIRQGKRKWDEGFGVTKQGCEEHRRFPSLAFLSLPRRLQGDVTDLSLA